MWVEDDDDDDDEATRGSRKVLLWLPSPLIHTHTQLIRVCVSCPHRSPSSIRVKNLVYLCCVMPLKGAFLSQEKEGEPLEREK